MSKMLLIKALICLLIVFAYRGSSATPPDSVCYVHYMNVGQGDATLLEFNCGAILIDAGAQNQEYVDQMISYMKDVFDDNNNLDSTIEAIIITHDHPDHVKGLKEVMKNFYVKRIIYNRMPGSRGDLAWAVNHIDEHQSEIVSLTYEDIIADSNFNGYINPDIELALCGGVEPVITFLSGGFETNPGWAHNEFDNENNHCLLVRVDFLGSSFLFTGDLEEDAINTIIHYYETGGRTDLFDVDVHHVGHHGSYNATTEELLDLVTPQMAVIPVGEWTYGQNSNSMFTTYSYGHPRRSTVKLLEDYIPNNKKRSTKVKVHVASDPKKYRTKMIKEKIYATAWDGNIMIRATAEGAYIVYTNQQ